MIELNQYGRANRVSAEQLDQLLAQGWRHFGSLFFRYSDYQDASGQHNRVMPLRLRLAAFKPARRHQRLLRKNADLRVEIGPTQIDSVKIALFERHKQRFHDNQPENLYDFLSHQPASLPCVNQQLCLYLGQQLVAVSFLDIGQQSTSGVYSIFDPEMPERGLGIYLILQSIQYSQTLAKTYYYPGYAYHQKSHYDYKKQFSGLEYFDWQAWQRLDLNPED